MFQPETLQNSLASGKQSYKPENIQHPKGCFIGKVVSKEVPAGVIQKQFSATPLLGISKKQNRKLKKWGENTSFLYFFSNTPCLGTLLSSQKWSWKYESTGLLHVAEVNRLTNTMRIKPISCFSYLPERVKYSSCWCVTGQIILGNFVGFF